MSDHPVTFRVEPPESPRKRLTVAFRPILAVPHSLLVGGPGFGLGIGSDRTGLLGAAAAASALINWFVVVFAGRAIQGLMDLQRYYLRWRANVLSYEALLRDEYPPFGEGEYAVSTVFPAVREGRNRWTVGFRLILVIPHVIVLAVLLIVWFLSAIIGWFAVLITGRLPGGLWRFGEGVMRWALRVEAYMLLLHDDYPPFTLGDAGAPAERRSEGAGPV